MDALTIFLAQYLVIGVALVGLITWLKLPRGGRIELAAAVILAAIAALVLSKVLGALYYHPRPFVTEHIKPVIAHAPDNGFPSDHTTLVMAVTTVIYYYRKRFALVALVLSLGVGIGRVLAHVHSPIDILGGLAAGVVAGALGFYIAQKLIPTLLHSSKSKD